MNKTEQPTPKRLREAVRSGDVARSRILFAAALSFGALLGLWQTVGSLETLLRLTRQMLGGPAVAPQQAGAQALETFRAMVIPPLGLGLLASVLTQLAVLRGNAWHGRLKFEFGFLDLGKNARRWFSWDRIKETSSALLLVVGAVVFVGASGRDLLLRQRPPGASVSELATTFVTPVRALQIGVAAVVAAGLVDLLRAVLARRKRLMMTKEEVRREHKSQEGDPHHKARRQALHRALGSGGAARGVAKADCVVVNPTHIAVALRYDERECDSPYIVAAARDDAALRLRGDAAQLEIPIVKNVALARALIVQDVGTAVSEELFEATAAVLAVAASQARHAREDHP